AAGSRPVGSNVTDQRALSAVRMESLGDGWSYILRQDAQVCALDFTMLYDLVHHIAGHIDRDGKADALVAARIARQDRGVYAGQVAVIVDERAARVARINRSVGLDKVFHFLDAESRAPLRADDTHSHGLADTERITHSENDIADFDFARVAQRHRWKI